MIVEVNKKFLKDLVKVPEPQQTQIEQFVFEKSPEIETLESTGVFEKLKGYSSYYRVRFGNFRVGVIVIGDKIVFERVLHRKEIYRYFP